MAGTDDEIDQLYRLPLAEFTPARNALAKRLGPAGATIKTLEKPSAPAWLVNQLFWRRRRAYDALVKAAENLRAAHRARLAGKSADVDAAEAAHRAAIRTAADDIRAFATEAGEPASGATMSAVNETLMALPHPSFAGRLVRPLRPSGLEALAGLMPTAGAALRLAKAAQAPPLPKPMPKAASGRSDKADAAATRAAEARAATQRKRELAEAERALREAKDEEREAERSLKQAREAAARAEREHDDLTRQVEAAAERLRRGKADVVRLHKAATDATAARARAGDRLEFMKRAAKGRES